MMKKLLISSVILFSSSVLFAQDTLLFENFDVDPTANYLLFNSGNDTQWVDFDADGLPDGNARPQNWFWNATGFSTVDSADACLFSSSWLDQFLPGNRNWLITPPIQIIDAAAVLSWASAPRQTPLYLDGYTVLVSTTDNMDASFTDTLFSAAQFLPPAGVGADFSTYLFSPGFIHGEDGTYVEFDPSVPDSSSMIGEFRPFTASLAAYSGQTIYIAFLHNSDDDNLIAIDDILVTGTLVGVKEGPKDLGLTVYPNPASEKIELNYSLPAASNISADIYDAKGSKVNTFYKGMQLAGQQKFAIDVTNLANGTYTVVLVADGASITTKFVKD